MANNTDDMTLALLGVAATKQTLEQPCPPDNIISAFIEQRVDKKTHAMMLSHLNQCENCYLTWKSLGLFLPEYNLQEIQNQKVSKTGFLERLKNMANSTFSWKIVAPGLAFASLSFAVVMTVPKVADKEVQPEPFIIARSSVDTTALAEKLDRLPLPWQDQTFGFSKSAISILAKAFGVGLWDAKSKLLNSNDPLPTQLTSETTINWQDSKYRYYYNFGKWALNTWMLANTKDVKLGQWLQQKQTLEELKTGLVQHQPSEAIIAIQIADKIKTHLDLLSQKPDISVQTTLSRDIEIGMQKIFL